MSQFLLHYERPDPVTWVYLSSLLSIALYFAFHRFWSVRNLDILLLVLLAPGLLLVHEGRSQRLEAVAAAPAVEAMPAVEEPPEEEEPLLEEPAGAGSSAGVILQAAQPVDRPVVRPTIRGQTLQRHGFLWLLGAGALLLLRMLLDPTMVRRPLLDPNLTVGGLNFLGASLLAFLMTNVAISHPTSDASGAPEMMGPGYPLLSLLPAIPTTPEYEPGAESPAVSISYAALARVLAIGAHLAVVAGIVLVGYRHFHNIRAGLGAAVLYLLLPYTAQMTGRVDHVVPAALLVWAVLMYRRPAAAGVFMGLAAGLVYYPLFLLPLWLTFYRQRGLSRFASGVTVTLAVLVIILMFTGPGPLEDRLQAMFGLWRPRMEGLQGIWGLGWNPAWRIPILAGFMILSFLFAFWPSQKNLGTLMSCSAAVMIAAQFWHGFGGGLYMAWYLPLVLLTVFRPNLEDRVALKVIGGNRRDGDLSDASHRTEAA